MPSRALGRDEGPAVRERVQRAVVGGRHTWVVSLSDAGSPGWKCARLRSPIRPGMDGVGLPAPRTTGHRWSNRFTSSASPATKRNGYSDAPQAALVALELVQSIAGVVHVIG